MIKINPKYEFLREYIENIPNVFEQEGETVYHKRNLIKVFTTPEGLKLNVKRYHRPHGPNLLVYSWNIRKPKAERAFEYPQILLQRGIETPEAVALIEDRGLLHLLGYSYFISLQCDYKHTLYEMGNAKPDTYEELAKALANYTVDMHSKGVLHKDYTPGNVLWDKDEQGYHFCIVDINRMSFGTVSVKDGLMSLRKFWGPKRFIEILAGAYGRLRGIDEQHAINFVMKERAKFWTRYQKKHQVEFKLEL